MDAPKRRAGSEARGCAKKNNANAEAPRDTRRKRPRATGAFSTYHPAFIISTRSQLSFRPRRSRRVYFALTLTFRLCHCAVAPGALPPSNSRRTLCGPRSAGAERPNCAVLIQQSRRQAHAMMMQSRRHALVMLVMLIEASRAPRRAFDPPPGSQNPCSASHPFLMEYQNSGQMWCYKSARGRNACNMAESGKVPPPGKAWGTNQPPCPPAVAPAVHHTAGGGAAPNVPRDEEDEELLNAWKFTPFTPGSKAVPGTAVSVVPTAPVALQLPPPPRPPPRDARQRQLQPGGTGAISAETHTGARRFAVPGLCGHDPEDKAVWSTAGAFDPVRGDSRIDIQVTSEFVRRALFLYQVEP